MYKIIVSIATTALALLIADEVITGLSIDSLRTALLAATVLGILHTFAKPILIILTLPITIVTLGFFIVFINVALFATAAWLLPGFAIAGMVPALLGTLLVSIVNIFVSRAQAK